MIRNATAVWLGTGKDGQGNLSTQSHVLSTTPYSYKTRFEHGPGTNPEELIAAAHAACFAMKLAFHFDAAGYPPHKLETKCEISFVNSEITNSHLHLKAYIPGVEEHEFHELVEHAGRNCPISKLLNTTLTISATLEKL